MTLQIGGLFQAVWANDNNSSGKATISQSIFFLFINQYQLADILLTDGDIMSKCWFFIVFKVQLIFVYLMCILTAV